MNLLLNCTNIKVSDDIIYYSDVRTLSNSLIVKSPDKIISLPISCIVLNPSFIAIAFSSGVVAFAVAGFAVVVFAKYSIFPRVFQFVSSLRPKFSLNQY